MLLCLCSLIGGRVPCPSAFVPLEGGRVPCPSAFVPLIGGRVLCPSAFVASKVGGRRAPPLL